MLSAFFRTARRLRREDKGAVLLLFLLLIVPLIMVIAVGIDLGQALIVKRQLAGGVDAAALAIGTDADPADQTQLEAKALAFVKAHYPDNGLGALKGTPTVERNAVGGGRTQINVSASAEVPTYFIKIGGIEKLTVAVSSQVLRQDNKLEVVMVLDNSGSMGGNKLAALKSAANTLVDILFGANTVSDKVKIGLVPFTAAVNVNVPSDTPWLDSNKPIPALLNSLLFLPSLTSGFTVLGVMNGGIAANWRGCVRSRYNLLGLGDPLDTTDAPPDPLNPQSLFSAYFNPFRPGGLPQALGLYNGVTSQQQNTNCPIAKVQKLTDTKTAIGTAINAMTAEGSTNIPEGLAWGWRLVSPREPFIEGAPYSDPSTIKAIILLTDGENNVAGNFSSYGPASNPQLGGNPNGTLNTKTTTVCNNIKADKDGDNADQDVLIYTIVFNVSSPTIETLMRNCASDTGKFFNTPSTAQLTDTFQAIARSLNQLRLTQ
jgi:Flp pilus assembly protein TadG